VARPRRRLQGLRRPGARRRAARRGGRPRHRRGDRGRARRAGGCRWSSATTCARRRGRWSTRSRRGDGRGVDVVDIGLASTDMLYFASGDLDAARRDVHRQHNPPTYNGIKLCRAGARRCRSTPGSPRSATSPPPGVPRGPAGTIGGSTHRGRARRASPPTCAPSSTGTSCARCASRSTPATAWPGTSWPGRSSTACRRRGRAVLRARRHLPEPPGQPDRAREPRDLQRVVREGAAARARLRRRRRPGVRGRRDGEPVSVVADRGGRRRPAARARPRRDRAAQPHLLAGRARDDRGRRRHAVRTRVGHSFIKAAHGRDRAPSSPSSTRATTTSATTTGPTRG
jgi:hypothetical protein